MLGNDDAQVVALVKAHLSGPEYVSVVPAHYRVRWDDRARCSKLDVIGGHVRRQPMIKKSIIALSCVCKQVDLSVTSGPPIKRKRARNF